MNVMDQLELSVYDITHTGEGIARYDNLVIFVQGAIPGETVLAEITKMKKTYATAIVKKRITGSSYAEKPVCPFFERCGGCQWLNMTYDGQLFFKEKRVKDALDRIGKLTSVSIDPIIGMDNPFHYRNKAQYKLSSKGIGFYEKRSHRVVPIDNCINQDPSCADVIATFNLIIEKFKLSVYDERAHKGLLRGIIQRTNQKSENMIILVINSKSLQRKEAIIEEICAGIPNVVSIYVNSNRNKGNVILGKHSTLIYGKPQLLERIGHCEYHISPASFFQVNTKQTKVLYDKVAEFCDLKGEEIVFDLFCGTGTIGIYLADQAKHVYGIEVVKAAVIDAKENARLNNIENIDFYEGRAETATHMLIEGKQVKPDIIIVDPPRKGCDGRLIDLMLELAVEKIVYVSCNPSTLARDLALLTETNYQVEKIQPVDLFPGTGHVETVVLMSRVEK